MNVKLSIVIVSWNVREDVENCIRSIYDNCPYFDYEIILVDNHSEDGTVEAVKSKFSDVLIIENQDNLGFAAANNIGIEKSKGEYLLVLNPDTVILPGSLESLVRFMDKEPNVGVCGPKILNPDYTTQPSVRHFPAFSAIFYRFTVAKYINLFRKQYDENMMRSFTYDRISDVDQLIGAAIILKKSLMKKLGGFDERFFMYYEEVDLCKRVKSLGLRNVFYPGAEIIHSGGQSSGQIHAKSRFMVLRSLIIYLRKYNSGLKFQLTLLLFKLGIGIRQLSEAMVNLLMSLLVFYDTKRFRKKLARSKTGFKFIIKYYCRLIIK